MSYLADRKKEKLAKLETHRSPTVDCNHLDFEDLRYEDADQILPLRIYKRD
jgi:hypothetical protein